MILKRCAIIVRRAQCLCRLIYVSEVFVKVIRLISIKLVSIQYFDQCLQGFATMVGHVKLNSEKMRIKEMEQSWIDTSELAFKTNHDLILTERKVDVANKCVPFNMIAAGLK